jgi:transcriptional regulator with PAS, ATPase and Fis domain
MNEVTRVLDSADRRGAANSTPVTPSQIVTVSRAMSEVVRRASKAGASDAKVLITGETGVGKDLIARSIHANSRRARGPFVAVNCAGLTETLLESELFGHVRGSFTGAYRDKAGHLQMAHRGTLFLDEVGEMSLRMQALLLRFLENGEIQPVGADHSRMAVDVRVIAATHRNLDERVAAGEFREDLLYRLRVIHVSVPPLRDRPEDIPLLVQAFVARFGRRASVSPAAMEVLTRHRWPGNVRELQNVIEETLALSSADVIEPQDLPHSIGPQRIKVVPQGERRRQVADALYDALVKDGYSFFEHVHPRFLARDITRHDVRELVRRGLATTRGNYRALLPLFGMSQGDYKRFLNFLTTHDCSVDYRQFRGGEVDPDPSSNPGVELANLVVHAGPARVEPSMSLAEGWPA